MRYLFSPLFLLAYALLSLPGCSTVESETDDSSILLGVSIDGIEPGFSTTQVVEILGEPFSVWDNNGSLFFYEYGNDEPGAIDFSVRIVFVEAFDDRVGSIVVSNHYQGTTEAGIGIGSSMQDVKQVLGAPDSNLIELNWGIPGLSLAEGDIYFSTQGERVTSLTYDLNERVVSIAIFVVTNE